MKNWTGAEWVSVLAALGTLVGTLVAGTIKILQAVREIHVAINSRMDELLAVTKAAAIAEGVSQQQAATLEAVHRERAAAGEASLVATEAAEKQH